MMRMPRWHYGEAGTVVANRYRLDSLLGQGGMGVVWKAFHLTLNVPVALKFIDPEIAGSSEALARFTREGQAAASLQSRHVVRIFDLGVAGEVPNIATEFLRGESLAERLVRRVALPPTETVRIVMHIAKAMTEAHHAGIIHRDLKPENVYICVDGDEEVGKVLDFGITKATGQPAHDSRTRTGAVLGTPCYMSPEQARGDKSRLPRPPPVRTVACHG